MSDGVAQVKQQVWRLVFALRFERLTNEDNVTPKQAADEAGRAAAVAAKEAGVRYQKWLDEV